MSSRARARNVPYNGQVQYWATDKKGFGVVTDWAPWYRTGLPAPAAGHVRTYSTDQTQHHQHQRQQQQHTFKFVVVSGAGHEVPTYRPAAARTMLTGFVLSDGGGGPDVSA